MEYKHIYSEVKCVFNHSKDHQYSSVNSSVMVYYGFTSELAATLMPLTAKFVSALEMERANKFRFSTDKETYLVSHSILRLILSDYLQIPPQQIPIEIDKNNKPFVKGGKVYFNLSHTKDSFAIVVAEIPFIGVDIEVVKPALEYKSVINYMGSLGEKEYVLGSFGEQALRRFYTVWTRKEAFLKALGVGLVAALQDITVSEKMNSVTQDIFIHSEEELQFYNQYINTREIPGYFLSVSSPVGNQNIDYRCIGVNDLLGYTSVKKF